RPWIRQRLAWPEVYGYEQVIEHALPHRELPFPNHPCLVPNWDNTPRSGKNGFVFHGATPRLFQQSLGRAVERVTHQPKDERLIFIKSWNEWAEGNYVEPDREFGRGYLEAIRAAIVAARADG